jgi:hypothetical protein
LIVLVNKIKKIPFMESICPNHEKCPIFNGILAGKEITAKSYRRMYCEAGGAKYHECKRFQVKGIFGKCPGDLLPNSNLSMEEIATRYQMTLS